MLQGIQAELLPGAQHAGWDHGGPVSPVQVAGTGAERRMKKGKNDPARWRVWPKEKKTRKPAAKREAEELVRCKECCHLEITGCYGECGRGYLGIVRPDDYCSRGERRK